MILNKTEAIIVHLPHDPTETMRLETRKDVEKYLRNSSGMIAYGNKKERIQQATNLKSIISWLMNGIDGTSEKTMDELSQTKKATVTGV